MIIFLFFECYFFSVTWLLAIFLCRFIFFWWFFKSCFFCYWPWKRKVGLWHFKSNSLGLVGTNLNVDVVARVGQIFFKQVTCTLPIYCIKWPTEYSKYNLIWFNLKLLSIESVMSSNHLILYRPLLLLPSTFPSISSAWFN